MEVKPRQSQIVLGIWSCTKGLGVWGSHGGEERQSDGSGLSVLSLTECGLYCAVVSVMPAEV